jgi:hypothetical protein
MVSNATNLRTKREYRQSVVEKLTSSVKEKLPRLTAKASLPTKPPRNQDNSIMDMSTKRGTLYLSASGSIRPIDHLSKKLETPIGMQLQMDYCNGSDSRKIDVAKHLVTTVFREAMQVMPVVNFLMNM